MLVHSLKAVKGDINHVVTVLKHTQMNDDEGVTLFLVTSQRSKVSRKYIKYFSLI